MAYEIGSASSAADLLDKIRIVAVARGWTVNNNSTPVLGDRWLSLRVGTAYFNLYASPNQVGFSNHFGRVGPYIYGAQATGYNGSAGWTLQPGTSIPGGNVDLINTPANTEMVGPFTSYRIFSSATYIHVVVELAPGIFSHLAMGVLTKYGAYTGGAYLSMSSWSTGQPNNPEETTNTYMFDNIEGRANPTVYRADIDGHTWFYTQANFPTNRATGGIRTFTSSASPVPQTAQTNAMQLLHTPNEFNLLSPLLPIVPTISRGSGLFSPIGRVPDLRVLNMLNFNSGDEYTLGGDTWVIIAARQKTLEFGSNVVLIPSSGNYGYAYKKIV
jgi:hypothetical protein